MGRLEKDGVVYVTIQTFADKVGRSYNTIREHVGKELIPVSIGNKKYLRLDEAEKAWKKLLKEREEKSAKKGKSFVKLSYLEIPDEGVKELEVVNEEFNLYAVDPKVLADCTDTRTGIIDYQRAVTKLKALVYQQQLDKESGKLVFKSDVLKALDDIFIPAVNAISIIPERFGTRLAAVCSELLGRELKSEEKTLISVQLEDTKDAIISNLKDALTKALEAPVKAEGDNNLGRPKKSETQAIVGEHV